MTGPPGRATRKGSAVGSKVYETPNGPHRVYSALPAQTGGEVCDRKLFIPGGASELTSDLMVLFDLAQPLDATPRIPCGSTRRLDLAPRLDLKPGETDITILACHVYRDGVLS